MQTTTQSTLHCIYNNRRIQHVVCFYVYIYHIYILYIFGVDFWYIDFLLFLFFFEL